MRHEPRRDRRRDRGQPGVITAHATRDQLDANHGVALLEPRTRPEEVRPRLLPPRRPPVGLGLREMPAGSVREHQHLEATMPDSTDDLTPAACEVDDQPVQRRSGNGVKGSVNDATTGT